jgi:hypothetical protein
MSDMHGDAGEGNRRVSASEGVITRIKTDYESRKQKRRNVQENRKQKQSFFLLTNIRASVARKISACATANRKANQCA